MEWRAADDTPALSIDAGRQVHSLARIYVQRALEGLNNLFERVRFVVVDGRGVNRSIDFAAVVLGESAATV